MTRALTTLIGFAAAAALLLLVPDVGASAGGDLWQRAGLIAIAGVVAGALYQAGGVRRPGMRLNAPVLVAVFLPWVALTAALVAHQAGTPQTLTDLVRDVLPDAALRRWSATLPLFAFGSGLLLAFGLAEPRIHAERVAAVDRELREPYDTASAAAPVERI
jgi:hypothetical protein